MALFDVKGQVPQKAKPKKQEVKAPLFSTTKKKEPVVSISDEYIPRFMYEGQFTEQEEPIASQIQQRRIQMLIHSRLYYELDYNVISDEKWSKWALELVDLQKQYPEIASKVCFADAFKDWDGNTGAFLPLNHPWVVKKVKQRYGR